MLSTLEQKKRHLEYDCLNINTYKSNNIHYTTVVVNSYKVPIDISINLTSDTKGIFI